MEEMGFSVQDPSGEFVKDPKNNNKKAVFSVPERRDGSVSVMKVIMTIKPHFSGFIRGISVEHRGETKKYIPQRTESEGVVRFKDITIDADIIKGKTISIVAATDREKGGQKRPAQPAAKQHQAPPPRSSSL